MKCPIKFIFTAGEFMGKFMTLKISSDHNVLFEGVAQKNFEVVTMVDFPSNIFFSVGDESAIEEGQNKFIQIQKVIFNQLEIDSWRFSTDILSFEDHYEKFQNTYWDRPGLAVLKINNSDPIEWLLDHRELLG